jgi:hypothetical protein
MNMASNNATNRAEQNMLERSRGRDVPFPNSGGLSFFNSPTPCAALASQTTRGPLHIARSAQPLRDSQPHQPHSCHPLLFLYSLLRCVVICIYRSFAFPHLPLLAYLLHTLSSTCVASSLSTHFIPLRHLKPARQPKQAALEHLRHTFGTRDRRTNDICVVHTYLHSHRRLFAGAVLHVETLLHLGSFSLAGLKRYTTT